MKITNKVDEKTQELLTTVIEWCMNDAPDWFDDSFVHAMYIRFEEVGHLTPAQVKALKNIATKFKII